MHACVHVVTTGWGGRLEQEWNTAWRTVEWNSADSVHIDTSVVTTLANVSQVATTGL